MKFKPTQTPGKMLVELDRGESFPAGANEKTTPLFELKNILVPIDFSDCSKKALAYALPYAREFGANITLLYVARFDYAASEMDSSEAPVLEGAHLERAKKELLKITQKLPVGIKIKTVVLTGKPYQEIVAAARDLDSDLIIIGTHGAMGVEREFMGSTAERVARYANCPVLIVRERERDFVTTNGTTKLNSRHSTESREK